MVGRVEVAEVLELFPLEQCNGWRCKAPIRRALTVGGKRMPLDPDPVDDAVVVIRRAPDGAVRAVVLAGHDPRDPLEPTWRPHWTTCPDAPAMRQPRRPSSRSGRCEQCRNPLDQVLARRTDWHGRWHPTCAPARPVPRPTAAAAPDEQEVLEL